jgi:hypothetical protein
LLARATVEWLLASEAVGEAKAQLSSRDLLESLEGLTLKNGVVERPDLGWESVRGELAWNICIKVEETPLVLSTL